MAMHTLELLSVRVCVCMHVVYVIHKDVIIYIYTRIHIGLAMLCILHTHAHNEAFIHATVEVIARDEDELNYEKHTYVYTRNDTFIHQARATVDFVARDEDELNFQKGDILNIQEKSSDEGWWEPVCVLVLTHSRYVHAHARMCTDCTSMFVSLYCMCLSCAHVYPMCTRWMPLCICTHFYIFKSTLYIPMCTSTHFYMFKGTIRKRSEYQIFQRKHARWCGTVTQTSKVSLLYSTRANVHTYICNQKNTAQHSAM